MPQLFHGRVEKSETYRLLKDNTINSRNLYPVGNPGKKKSSYKKIIGKRKNEPQTKKVYTIKKQTFASLELKYIIIIIIIIIIPLALSCQLFFLSIVLGRSSRRHPVSTQSFEVYSFTSPSAWAGDFLNRV